MCIWFQVVFDWVLHACRSTVLLAAVVVVMTCIRLAWMLQMLKSRKVVLAEWSCTLAASANVSPGAALFDVEARDELLRSVKRSYESGSAAKDDAT